MTPNTAQPRATPIRPPLTPPYRAPKVTKGIVPNVARPQLNAMVSSGNPRLLNAVLATKRQARALPRLPLRRQYGVQQPRISTADHGVQLGPRDVGHDSLRDLWRAVWRREGWSDRRRPWLRRVRRHRRRDGLCGDCAVDESPGGARAAMLRPARLRRRAGARVSAPICEALEGRRRRGSVICNAAQARL